MEATSDRCPNPWLISHVVWPAPTSGSSLLISSARVRLSGSATPGAVVALYVQVDDSKRYPQCQPVNTNIFLGRLGTMFLENRAKSRLIRPSVRCSCIHAQREPLCSNVI